MASIVTLGMTGTPADDAPPRRDAIPEAAVSIVHPELPDATRQSLGQEAYLRHCTICHGEQGRGDGPAAGAFDPGPPDFTDPDGLPSMTDDELLDVVSRGRRSMPAFDAVLEPEVLTEVVDYLRELSGKGD